MTTPLPALKLTDSFAGPYQPYLTDAGRHVYVKGWDGNWYTGVVLETGEITEWTNEGFQVVQDGKPDRLAAALFATKDVVKWKAAMEKVDHAMQGKTSRTA